MRSLSLAAMASLGVPISFVIAMVRMMASCTSGSRLLRKPRSSYIEANQSQTLLLEDVTNLTTDSTADFWEPLLSMRLEQGNQRN